jgi:Tfp pilus assembly ATPase PilU
MVLLGIIKNYKLPAVPKNKIYVVYRGQGGFQKKSFSVKKRNIKIEENYNDDFPEISNDIITKLNYKGKTGLVILHGSPGTGKCVIGKTKITVRNKKTGIIEDRYIEDLM